jgi:8-oxo-dGTP pyrophosphatase MutT (NUDIX family)
VTTQPVIRVSAVLAVDDAGRLLVVRKRGTEVWMQPGGKPEPGETAAETLARELREELGVRLNPAELEPLGTFTTDAANEAGTTLIADVFAARIEHPVVADAEIDAVRWMHPREFPHHKLAPLITQHMLALMPRGGSATAANSGTNGTRHEPPTLIP